MLLVALGLVGVHAQSPDEPLPPRETFAAWLEQFIGEALARGLSAPVVHGALADIEPLERVIQSDRTQAELTPGLDRYLSSRVTPAVIRRGRALAREHRALLTRISKTYGVPGSIVLAIWGVESRYGRVTGRIPIPQALATLAWEGRRAGFFREQLFDALTVVDRGYIEAGALRGSWAGAMGQPQFMPSSYLNYAVDFDEDGRRDIWGSTPDALASIANYLARHGWEAGTIWGREVTMPRAGREAIVEAFPGPTEGCFAMRNMTGRAPLREWRARGLARRNGQPLPRTGPDAALVSAGTRHFLVYPSYGAVLGYNCAHYYALSVSLLSDQLR